MHKMVFLISLIVFLQVRDGAHERHSLSPQAAVLLQSHHSGPGHVSVPEMKALIPHRRLSSEPVVSSCGFALSADRSFNDSLV